MMMSKIYVIKYDDLDDTEYHTETVGYVLTEDDAKKICNKSECYYEEVSLIENI